MTDQPLGTFDDRYTMRYMRHYNHPPERVWEAITTAEHLDVWMMPKCRVDARPGGRFGFSFGDLGAGSTAPSMLEGTIAEWLPERVVEYRFDEGSAMRFELTPTEGGCRLDFVHSFPPDFQPPPAHPDDPGADHPGGPDTPWRPGFTAGFHLCLDTLAQHLDGVGPDIEEVIEGIQRHHRGEYAADWLELVDVYRRHIRETIPPE